MERLLKFLQSNQAVLFAAIMSLTTQLWHSVKAFVMLDVGGTLNYWNYLFGVMFSVSTSFAILLFTVRGRKNWAYFFLVVEVFINIIHYGVMGMEANSILYATVFMCVIVPVTIGIYSAEINVHEYDIPEAIGVENQEFINQVNTIIGFDITNPTDTSGRLKNDTRDHLRKLWKERKVITKSELLNRARFIVQNN